MTEPTLDVVAIGNAIVDVIAPATDAFLAAEGLTKGDMQLIEAERAVELYGRMGPGREVSGGSAANTLAGVAALGGRAAFVGQVADDQLGTVFRHDLTAAGVRFDTPARAGDPPTARCLVLVTPEGERTMNTFLGASHYLPAQAMDEALIGSAAVLYLEGYLWDPAEPRAAMVRAIGAARAAGRRVAFGPSAGFVIARHGADFRRLMDEGAIDILFANEEEIAALMETDVEAAIDAAAARVPLVVVTRGERGATAVRGGERVDGAAEPVARVVDTTGAGDLFAAGFLLGEVRGLPLAESLKLGAIAAAEVIGHYGARPEADLKALAGLS